MARYVSDDVEGFDLPQPGLATDTFSARAQATCRATAAYRQLMRDAWAALLLYEFSRNAPLSVVAEARLHEARMGVISALGLQVAP